MAATSMAQIKALESHVINDNLVSGRVPTIGDVSSSRRQSVGKCTYSGIRHFFRSTSDASAAGSDAAFVT